jgi:hypothetical protein
MQRLCVIVGSYSRSKPIVSCSTGDQDGQGGEPRGDERGRHEEVVRDESSSVFCMTRALPNYVACRLVPEMKKAYKALYDLNQRLKKTALEKKYNK